MPERRMADVPHDATEARILAADSNESGDGDRAIDIQANESKLSGQIEGVVIRSAGFIEEVRLEGGPGWSGAEGDLNPISDDGLMNTPPTMRTRPYRVNRGPSCHDGSLQAGVDWLIGKTCRVP